MSTLSSIFSIKTANAVSILLDVPTPVLAKVGYETNSHVSPWIQYVQNACRSWEPIAPIFASFQLAVSKHLDRFSPSRQSFPSQFQRLLPLMNPTDVLLITGCFLCIWMVILVMSRLILGSRYHRFTVSGFLLYPALAASSLYISLAAGFGARAAGYNLWNNHSGSSVADWRLTKIWWCFMVFRMFEWSESLWLLLRYKQRACLFDLLRFTTALPVTWFIGVVSPAGDTYFFVLVSATVQFMLYIHNWLTLVLNSHATVESQRAVMNTMLVLGLLVQFLLFGGQFGYDFLYLTKETQNSNPLSVLISLGYTMFLLLSFSLCYPSNSSQSGSSSSSPTAKKKQKSVKASPDVKKPQEDSNKKNNNNNKGNDSQRKSNAKKQQQKKDNSTTVTKRSKHS